jgi:hypothetical protein
MLKPLNRSLTASIPYILPHPPLISCTSRLVHCNSFIRSSQISFSFSLRWEGAWRISWTREISEGIPAAPEPMVPSMGDSEEVEGAVSVGDEDGEESEL